MTTPLDLTVTLVLIEGSITGSEVLIIVNPRPEGYGSRFVINPRHEGLR